MRKMASKEGRSGANRHCATLLRLADMYLGYAETLSACDQRNEAIKYVNKIRARAGIPGYGAVGTKDDNGFACIPYEDTRDGVDKRIHRERCLLYTSFACFLLLHDFPFLRPICDFGGRTNSIGYFYC